MAGHYLILGAAREGVSAYHFLRQHRPELHITFADDKPLSELPVIKNILQQDSLTSFISSWQDKLNSYSHIVKSAGVSPFQESLQNIPTGVTLTSPTQLFFAHCPGKIIGITGTKGKSTTTQAIFTMLTAANKNVKLGGNIGIPALDLLTNKPASDLYVLELSSHQLYNLPYSPHIAVLQEISSEHLDYYPDTPTYQQAKQSITANQTKQDYVIYFANSDISNEFAQQSLANKIGFTWRGGLIDKDKKSNISVQLNNQYNNKNAWHVSETGIFNNNNLVLAANDVMLRGGFNLLNLTPALIVANLLNIPMSIATAALKAQLPLPHRLEEVAQIAGVTYINDSLSTTPQAAAAALASFPKKQIILILGGYDRGLDQSALVSALRTANLKGIVFIPTTGNKIKKLLQQDAPAVLQVPHFTTTNMDEAVQTATQWADANDVVLLSPGAASFNLFTDYAQRGDAFKQAVLKLVKKI